MEPPDSETLTFEAGEVLIARDCADGNAFVLLTGSARIEDETAAPPLIVGPGARVGADNLQLRQSQRAQVVAVERVSARRLSRTQLGTGAPPGAGMTDQAAQPLVSLTAETDELARHVGIRNLSHLDLPFIVGRKPARTERAPRTPLDLVLGDVRPFNLSRRHFSIDTSVLGPVIHDPGSHLGTIVNGVRIGTGHPSSLARLHPGTNHLVAGANNSPFRFVITVAAG